MDRNNGEKRSVSQCVKGKVELTCNHHCPVSLPNIPEICHFWLFNKLGPISTFSYFGLGP